MAQPLQKEQKTTELRTSKITAEMAIESAKVKAKTPKDTNSTQVRQREQGDIKSEDYQRPNENGKELGFYSVNSGRH